MNTEKTKEILKSLQVKEARAHFEAFGRIEKVFMNGAEIKPWHIDAVLVEIVRDQARIRGFAVIRIGGVCTLRVSIHPMEQKRRRA